MLAGYKTLLVYMDAKSPIKHSNAWIIQFITNKRRFVLKHHTKHSLLHHVFSASFVGDLIMEEDVMQRNTRFAHMAVMPIWSSAGSWWIVLLVVFMNAAWTVRHLMSFNGSLHCVLNVKLLLNKKTRGKCSQGTTALHKYPACNGEHYIIFMMW